MCRCAWSFQRRGIAGAGHAQVWWPLFRLASNRRGHLCHLCTVVCSDSSRGRRVSVRVWCVVWCFPSQRTIAPQHRICCHLPPPQHIIASHHRTTASHLLSFATIASHHRITPSHHHHAVMAHHRIKPPSPPPLPAHSARRRLTIVTATMSFHAERTRTKFARARATLHAHRRRHVYSGLARRMQALACPRPPWRCHGCRMPGLRIARCSSRPRAKARRPLQAMASLSFAFVW